MQQPQLTVEESIERQLELAEDNYCILKEKGVRSIGLMGTAGSGKTSLIERIIDRVKPCGIVMAALVGASSGTDDHNRFLARGIYSANLNTESAYQLEAQAVNRGLGSLPLAEIDLLFVENVGGLLCQADWPLGTESEVVVISAAAGEAVVRKHPNIFTQTDLLVINKIELAAAAGVDPGVLVDDYAEINPYGKIVLTDARGNRGIDELMRTLGIECEATQW
ncbi:MAG: hydrogenase nickel incorporation protein HypB [Candidatus Bipolaricaulota bacterium]|nr:hydrogenase nickel incorporation protein HypB [Candidatus Bipolaricaulota bacterium]